MPFTDIQYAGAEVAASSSVIASCHIPMAVGVYPGQSDNYNALSHVPVVPLDKLKATGRESFFGRGLDLKDPLIWKTMGFGMADYIFGIPEDLSYKSADSPTGGFSRYRDGLYSGTDVTSNENFIGPSGTSYIEMKQWITEEQALDEISTYRNRLLVGFVIGPRDVKFYYTETALGMMARRMRNVVEALGPMKPTYYPLGLGHLSNTTDGKPWRPGTGQKATVTQPTYGWDAGAVQYKNRALRAAGNYYIPWDQVPYGTQRRNFKFNHIMNQLGIELLECLEAIGADLDNSLTHQTEVSFTENGAGAQVAALQMLFSSLFGASSTISTTDDFKVDETSIHNAVKEYIGMFFNSGHIHVDPGVLAYRGMTKDGLLMNTHSRSKPLRYKGRQVTPMVMMKEFCAKYLTFCVAAASLQSYVTVPLYECHWLYTGSPKPEYVTEQLQMNFRPDVVFDGGDSSLPFTLIPSRLNPGEIISRIPCYLNMPTADDQDKKRKIDRNLYLGIRDPMPYGSVLDIRFAGDRPQTIVEEREYTFTPIIEADASVISQYRNSKHMHAAVWPRPTHYVPGATRLGVIYGLMADNASVGGQYYYQPLTGVMQLDGLDDVIYRTMNAMEPAGEDVTRELLIGQTAENIERHEDYWNSDKRQLLPDDNPQNAIRTTNPVVETNVPANYESPNSAPTLPVSGGED